MPERRDRILGGVALGALLVGLGLAISTGLDGDEQAVTAPAEPPVTTTAPPATPLTPGPSPTVRGGRDRSHTPDGRKESDPCGPERRHWHSR